MPRLIWLKLSGPPAKSWRWNVPETLVNAMRESFRRRGLSNVKIHELDLMTGILPKANYDFSWCRWVLSFVSDPSLLIRKLGAVMPKGGISIFHEHVHYETWRYFLSADRGPGKISRTCDRDPARIRRRTGWWQRPAGITFREWFSHLDQPSRSFSVFAQRITCGNGR